MPNILQNGGFEDDNGWTYRFGAARSTVTAYAGLYSGLLPKDPLQLSAGQISQVGLGLNSGSQITVRLRARPSGANDDLRIELDKGDGLYVIVATADKDVPGWTEVLVTVTALGSTGRFRISALHDNDGLSWLVDEVELRGVVGKTNDLYEALKTDLDTVSGLNVFGEPSDPLTVPLPAAILSSHGGSSDPDQITTQSGESEQEFGIKLVLQSSSPHEAIHNLLDEVRNALEPRGGTLNATGEKVLYAVVDTWGEVVTSDDIHDLRASIDGTVVVKYGYKLGAL